MADHMTLYILRVAPLQDTILRETLQTNETVRLELVPMCGVVLVPEPWQDDLPAHHMAIVKATGGDELTHKLLDALLGAGILVAYEVYVIASESYSVPGVIRAQVYQV